MKNPVEIIIEIQTDWLKVLWGASAVLAGRALAIHHLSDDEITKSLAGLFAEEKIKLEKADITIVIPRQDILARDLRLPSHNSDEIRQMVELQIFKHLPLTNEEVMFGHEIIHRKPDGNSKVTVFAVERKAAMRLWRICRSAGAWARQMTVSSLSIPFWSSRMPARQAHGMDACMVVDHEATELCLCSQDRVMMSRAFRMGQNILKDGVPGEWFEQIDASLHQYRKECPEEPIRRFLVIADETTGGSIGESLREKYRLPVESPADHPEIIDGGSFASDLLPHLAVVYAAAQQKKTSGLNLLPPEARFALIQRERRRYLIRIAVLSVLVFGAALFARNIVTVKRHWYSSQLQREIMKDQSKIKDLEAKLQATGSIDHFLEERLILADVVDGLDQKLPSMTLLTMLTINEARRMVLQGVSRQASDVNALQSSLENSRMFGNVKLDYMNKTLAPQGEVFVFQMTCQPAR